MRSHSTRFGPDSNAGHLYYVRVRSRFGPLYKIGFTKSASVAHRFTFKNNGDEKLLDAQFLFAYHDDAFGMEERLHTHFSSKKAFGNFASHVHLPLYQNGQSELYPVDVLGIDPEYTERQGAQTLASLAKIGMVASVPKTALWIVIVGTALRWFFLAVWQILLLFESVVEVVFRVDAQHRGILSGTKERKKQQATARQRAHAYQQSMDALFAWVRQNCVHIPLTIVAAPRVAKAAETVFTPDQSRQSSLPVIARPDANDAVPFVFLNLGSHEPIDDAEKDGDACVRVRDDDAVSPAPTLEQGNDSLPTYDHVLDDSNNVSAGDRMLWDGLLFDREDWLEHAFASGADPNAMYNDTLPAIFVAAYLGRSRAVAMLARHGAEYPPHPIIYQSDAEEALEIDTSECSEPAIWAIRHDDMGMLQTLLGLPWKDVVVDEEPVNDGGCAYAAKLAEKGHPQWLIKIVEARFFYVADEHWRLAESFSVQRLPVTS